MDVYVDTNSCNRFVDRQHHIVVSDKQNGPAVKAQTDVVRPTAAEYAASRDRTIDGVLCVDELADDFLAWRGAFHGIVALEVNHHLDWRDPESIFLRHLGASIRALVSPAAPHTRERPRLAA